MNTKTLAKLKDKERRALFIAGQIKNGIAFQVRALRDKYGWTQAQLGNQVGMPQTVISRIENPSDSNLTIPTLLKLATAFDVALIVRFEPINRLIEWVENLSPEKMTPEPSEKILADLAAQGGSTTHFNELITNQLANVSSAAGTSCLRLVPRSTAGEGIKPQKRDFKTLPLFDRPVLAWRNETEITNEATANLSSVALNQSTGTVNEEIAESVWLRRA